MQALGLLIEGYRDPLSGDSGDTPVLFVEGVVADVSAVSDLAAFASLQIRSWIPLREDGMGGFSWGATPREPFGEGSPITVQLLDKENLLCLDFCEDLGDVETVFYRLADKRVTRSQTTFRVYNTSPLDPPPQVDHYLWLRHEALFVTNVISLGNGVYDVDVSRAQCGSRALAHRVRPRNAFGAGEDAIHTALYMTSRIDFDHQYVPCRLYQFDVDAGGAATVRSRRYGFISQRPRPTGVGFSVVIEDDAKRMAAHEVGYGAPDVAISHCVKVVTAALSGSALGSLVLPGFQDLVPPSTLQPQAVEVYLRPAEVEQIFGESVRALDEVELDQAGAYADLVSSMALSMTGALPLRPGFWIEAGGWSGLMALKSLGVYAQPDGSVLAKASLVLLEDGEGSIGDVPVEVLNDASDIGARIDGLNAGWSNTVGELLRPGEDPPQISLWYFAPQGVSMVEAFLYLYYSDLGDGANHATYDALGCCGFNGDTARINLGAAPADPVAVDSGTTQLLELNALLPEKFEYRFPVGQPWGPWLKNESLRSMCLWVYEPSSGKAGWRQMDRPGPTSVTTLKPLQGSRYKVAPGTRLPAVERIRFEVGFQGKSLTFQDFRYLRLATGDSYDPTTGAKKNSDLTIRYWKRVPHFFQSLVSGPLPRLFNFYSRQLKASPSAFKVPVSVLQGAVKQGDFVDWTDSSIQTAGGRGVSHLICQVMAVDYDYQHGPEWLLLIPHALSLMRTLNGRIAPALKIFAVEGVSAGVYDCWVNSLGDPAFNITTSYSGILVAMATLSARVRVLSTTRHNPVGQKERKGWLEASATVSSARLVEGQSVIRISIDSAWTRSGAIDLRADLLVPGQSYIVLSDRRRAGANVENAEIVPGDPQRAQSSDNVIDIANFAPAAPEQPYDGFYYLFTA